MKQCSSCGLLLEHSSFHKDKSTKDGYRYICKDCVSSYQQIRRMFFSEDEQRLEKEKWAEYQKKNRPLCNQRINDWRSRNKEKWYGKHRKRNKECIDVLGDSYLKVLLSTSHLKPKDVPKALIEAKRLELSIKRFIKEKVDEKR